MGIVDAVVVAVVAVVVALSHVVGTVVHRLVDTQLSYIIIIISSQL